MPETDIAGAESSDLTNTIQDFGIASESTDSAQGDGEFRFQIEDWNKNLGFYKTIPELKTAINTKAIWIVGGGYEADELVTLQLDTIRGHGTDSFNSILGNAIRVYTLAGDSFTEIIRDDGLLVNLKPLDPSSIVIVSNEKGIIIRYEQVNKSKKVINSFSPEKMFHLSKDRIADEIHGTSVIPAVEWIILARNEAMHDWKRVLHRNVDPLWIFHLDTDDTAEIAAFKTKNDNARASGENMYVPKGVVVPELVATATNASLNPLAWIAQLNDYFFQVVNTPQIIVGNAKAFTDASGKIVYLSYEQTVKSEQLYIEEQVLNQLNIEIKLTFPASLQNELVSDTPNLELEEEKQEPAAQPNDTTAETEGKT